VIFQDQEKSLSIKRLCCALLALGPLVYLIVVVVRFSVDVPFWDEWGFIPFLEKSYQGTLSLRDFWAQENEQRPIFPKAIMLVLARLTGWNIAYEVGFSVSLAVGIFIALMCQIRATLKSIGNSRTNWWVAPLLSLMVFSMSQAKNWLWGYQLNVFLNLLAALTGIFLLARPVFRWWRFACAALLGIIATYSFANGMVYWPIGLAMLAVSSPSRKAAASRAIIWGAVGALAIGSYLYNFKYPSYYPSLWSSLERPTESIAFLLSYLGQPLASFVHRDHSALTGLFGILLLSSLLWVLIKSGRMTPRQIIPFGTLAAYIIGTAAMASVGRVGLLGSEGAFQGRYVTYASQLWVVNVVLLWILIDSSCDGSNSVLAERGRDLSIIAMTMVALLIFRSWEDGNRQYFLVYDERMEARDALLSVNNVELLNHLHASEIVRSDLLERLSPIDYLDKQVPVLVARNLSLFRDAPAASPSHVVAADFDGLVRLVGYDLSKEVVAGSPLELTLYWQRLVELDRQHLAFAHLIDDQWRMWGQADGIPRVGVDVSDEWGDGRMLRDGRIIELPADVPSGMYRLEIGIYRPDTMERLKLGGAGLGDLDDRVLTVPIQVKGDE
jgi:hypothetical protein